MATRPCCRRLVLLAVVVAVVFLSSATEAESEDGAVMEEGVEEGDDLDMMSILRDAARRAHGGLFAHMDWTDDELLAVSTLHATARYGQLPELVEAKLRERKTREQARTARMHRFFERMQPPAVFDDVLTANDRLKMAMAHRRHDIFGVVSILERRLIEAGAEANRTATDYTHCPPDSGAMVADEEAWNEQTRKQCLRKLHGNHQHHHHRHLNLDQLQPT